MYINDLRSEQMESLSGARKKVVKGQMWHMGLCYGLIWEGLVLTHACMYVYVCVCFLVLGPHGLGSMPKRRKGHCCLFTSEPHFTILLSVHLDRTVKNGAPILIHKHTQDPNILHLPQWYELS